MNRYTICFVLLVFQLEAYEASPSCQPRDQEAAAKVGRHCFKPCANESDCNGPDQCVCDHQCGMTCLNLETECGQPPSIRYMEKVKVQRSNGQVTDTVLFPPFRYNDFAVYECLPGYKLASSDATHMCHAKKGWTIKSSVCVPDCFAQDPTRIESENLTCRQPCSTDGDCNESERCSCDGSCGASCVERDLNCGDAPPSNHSRLEYTGEGLDRVVHYICLEGFYPTVGSVARKCTGGGTYDGQLPNCARVECGDPTRGIGRTGGTAVSGGNGPYYVGHEVRFSCPSSHRLVGSPNSTCTASGLWSGVNPVCQEKNASSSQCPHPGVPINGKLVSNITEFAVGTVVEFECDSGYIMSGDSRQECIYIKQWSDGGAPKCLDPDYPAHEEQVAAQVVDSTDLSLTPMDNETCGKQDTGSEVYFVIDFSGSDEMLLKSLATIRSLLVVASQSNSPYGRVVILAYAETMIILKDFHLRAITIHDVIVFVDRVRVNRVYYHRLLGVSNRADVALVGLEGIISSSYTQHTAVRSRRVYFSLNGLPANGIVVVNRMKELFGANAPLFFAIHPCVNCQTSWASMSQVLRAIATSNKYILLSKDPYHLRVYLNRYIAVVRGSHYPVVYGSSTGVAAIKKLAHTTISHTQGHTGLQPGAWPWYTSISSVSALLGDPVGQLLKNIVGGGSLINHAWILTSARLFNFVPRVDGWMGQYRIVIGATSLTVHALRAPTSARIFGSARVLIHPKFAVALQAFEHEATDYDVALIRIGSEYVVSGSSLLAVSSTGWVAFSKYVHPISLPCSEHSCVDKILQKAGSQASGDVLKCMAEEKWMLDSQNSALFADIGIGYNRALDKANGSHSTDHLRQELFTLDQRQHCSMSSAYMTVSCNVTFTERMFCGVASEGCVGDIGGPLAREVYDPSTKESCWVQSGISSWNYGCRSTYKDVNGKTQFYPNYYTDLFRVIPWIRSNIDAPVSTVGCQLPSLIHGQAFPTTTQRDFVAGETVAFACSSGRQVSLPSEILCEGDGQWSDPVPTCGEAVDGGCMSQTLPPNMSQDPSDSIVSNGSQVTFSCAEGTEISGSQSSTCLSNGSWSNEPPSCVATHCTVPPITHGYGDREGLVAIGEATTFACDSGYQISGEEQVTCNDGGIWSTSFPTCVAKQCPHRPITPHMSVVPQQTSWMFGEYAIYNCEPGYKLIGSNVLICMATGEWSGDLPTCGKDVSCPALAAPEDGAIAPTQVTWSNGDTAHFACDDGYRLVGPASTRCGASGNWSNPVPACSNCNFHMTANHGPQIITSPEWPNGYPDSSNCLWNIGGSFGWSVKFNFLTLSTSPGDFVEIKSGGLLVKRFEGSQGQTNVSVDGVDVQVKFHSDEKIPGIGFYATFQLGCGFKSTATTSHKDLASPGWPDGPSDASNCTWVITGRAGWPTEITFTEFRSTNAYLEVAGSSGVIRKLQGHVGATKVVANKDVITIRLVSNSSSDGARFHATYALGCGQDLQATTSQLPITSPAWPNSYTPSTDCTWTISGGFAWSILIDVRTFRTKPNDYLRIESDGGLIQTLEGILEATTITVNSQSVQLIFHSDGFLEDKGFSIYYSLVCGFPMTASATPQVISSPGWPQPYPTSRNCLWKINSLSGWYLIFNFTTVEISNDQIYFYSGSSLQTRISTESVVTLTAGDIDVKFDSGSSGVARGFNGTFWMSCGYDKTASSTASSLQSPGWPDNYPPSTDCVWNIKGQVGWNVTFTFTTFDTAYGDYLEIQSDGVVAERISGSVGARVVMVTGVDISVTFHSDDEGQGIGFIGSYKLTCGFTAVASTLPQPLTSPDWPHPYPGEMVCRWDIVGKAGWNIHFNFTTLDTSDDELCIYRGPCWEGNNDGASYFDNRESMYLTFVPGATSQGTGFSGTYTLTCGFDVNATTSNKVINSPNWPDNYPGPNDCVWNIKAIDGWNITFTFTTFYTEPNDYLQIWSQGQLVASLSGELGLTKVMVQGPDVKVIFHSNNNTEAPGFYGSYLLTCGFTTTASLTRQVITSPGWPGKYPTTTTCRWDIVGLEGWYINVNFSDFSISDDSLSTYGGPTLTGALGQTSYFLNRASTYLTFKSGATSQASGFRATYYLSCGYSVNVSTSAQTIRSPSWPSNYPPNTTCMWRIKGKVGWNVTFTFTKFDLGKAGDTLQIESDGVVVKSLHGNLETASVVVTGLNIVVRFQSNDEVEGTGFLGTFVQSCGFTSQATKVPQVITSPSWPESYPGGMTCRWDILGEAGFRTVFNITKFHTADDTVTFYGGGSYSGTVLPPVYYSTYASTYMKFSSSATSEGGGFYGTYYLSCGFMLSATTSNQVINSPGWPNNYPAATDCEWFIGGSPGWNVTFSFTSFGTQRSNDYLQIAGDDVTVSNLTGDIGPNDVMIQANDVKVKFHSDAATQGIGFTGTFKLTCGFTTHVTQTPQTITSPGWPGSYSPSMTCRWDFVGKTGWYIHFNFTTLDVSDDTMTVHYGPTLTGNLGPTSFDVDRSSTYIKFNPGATSQGRGFIGTYYLTCGIDVQATTSDKAIRSPSWPDNYPANTDCVWHITGQQGWNVTFTFSRFQTESENDYLLIESNYNSSHKLTGNLGANKLILEGTEFTLRFHSNQDTEGIGFLGSFKLTCGFTTTASTSPQIITSPDWPHAYPGGVTCRWDVQGKTGWYLKFDVTQFHTSDDALTTYTGPTLSGNVGTYDFWLDRSSTYLRFSSNAASHGLGFRLSYVLVCGLNTTASTSSTVIRSPNWGSPYPTDTDCEWNIKGQVGYSVVFSFTAFRTETNNDYLQIVADGSVVRTMSGNIGKVTVTAPGVEVKVRFHSNGNVTQHDSGFIGYYKLVGL